MDREAPPVSGPNGRRPPTDAATDRPLDVLVLAPTGRDAHLVARMLDGAYAVSPMLDPAALGRRLREPHAGAVILTEEALGLGLDPVVDALDDEPDWSEVPFVLFVGAGWTTENYLGLQDLLGRRGSVTVLERPIGLVAFQSVVEAAIGARRQQLRVRDLLQRLGGFNEELRRRVEEQTAALREQAEQVRELALEISRAEHRERERISQILHDDVQQLLYGIKIHLNVMRRADAVEASAVRRVEGYIDEAIDQTRHLTTDLHPPTLVGDSMAAALGWVADFARDRHGMTVHVDAPDGLSAPASDVLALLVRASKELLFNVVKHSGTTEAWVRGWCDDEGCHVVVRDEGAGFATTDASEGTGSGLSAIRDRVGLLGGHLDMDSAPGEGATVAVVVPDGPAV